MGKYSGVSILGGLAKGFAMGRQNKLDREDRKEMNALRKQVLNVKLADSKSKSQREAFIMKIVQSELDRAAQSEPTPVSAAAKPASFGESFSDTAAVTSLKEGGVAEDMAQKSIMDKLSPMGLAAFKEMSGIDVLGAGRLSEQKLSREQRGGFARQRQDLNQQRFDREDTEYKIVNVPDGKGGTMQVKMPKYGGSGTEQLLGQQPPDLATRTVQEGGETFEQPVNPKTREAVGPAVRTKKKPGLSGDVAGKYGMLQSGLNAVKQVKSMIMPNGVVDAETYKMLAEGSVNMPWSKGREVNALIFDALEGKIRIESGAAVPEEEIRRMAKRFKPSPLDSKKLISSKLERLEAYLTGTIELLDPNKNYANNALTMSGEDGKKYVLIPAKKMPDAMKKKLKEGVHTEFGNGQVWTLKNGQPERVE